MRIVVAACRVMPMLQIKNCCQMASVLHKIGWRPLGSSCIRALAAENVAHRATPGLHVFDIFLTPKKNDPVHVHV